MARSPLTQYSALMRASSLGLPRSFQRRSQDSCLLYGWWLGIQTTETPLHPFMRARVGRCRDALGRRRGRWRVLGDSSLWGAVVTASFKDQGLGTCFVQCNAHSRYNHVQEQLISYLPALFGNPKSHTRLLRSQSPPFPCSTS